MQVGDTVAERFRILELVGSGGMGNVYRAEDTNTKEMVALKLLLQQSPELARRFAREGAVLANLTHPSIVRYVAHGLAPDGAPYLAMEWLEGEDLQVALVRGLTMEESLDVVVHAAEALQDAHGKGVVHRDIKPSNIFLVERDSRKVKLLDFGIAAARGATALTRHGAMLGTPGYMSPEQARGEPVDVRSDIFSLGCVAFQCLTGRAPFVADHVVAVLMKILLEEPPRVRDLRAEVPVELDQIIHRMMAKDRKGRPSSAREVVEHLRDVGLATPTRRPDSVQGSAGITFGERRVVSIVLAPQRVDPSRGADRASTVVDDHGTMHPESTAGGGLPDVRLLVRRCGANVEVLADGTLVGVLAGGASATDLAQQAARCALAVRDAMGDVPVVLATGRRDASAALPLGALIDRAGSLLAAASEWGGDVLVDHVTRDLLQGRFELMQRGSWEVLLRERAIAEPARRLLGRASPFVGREREIATLVAAFDECVAEPLARAAVVTGVVGAGKSRFRDELVRRARLQTGEVVVWLAQGDPMRSGAPLGLLGSALRHALGLVGAVSSAPTRQRLLERVASVVPAGEAQRVAEFIGEIVQLPFPAHHSPQLRAAREDALVMADQTRRAWVDLLAAETAAHPVLLVLEDLHWGDLPTVKLVDDALRELADAPWMALALARPEVDELFPGLWAKRRTERVTLGPLTRRSVERLVRAVLPEASSSTIERIARIGQGNAFYVEELVRAVARGEEALPDTVLAMVHSHLERIDTDARRALRAASIFGQVFWRGGVDTLLGAGAVGLPVSLQTLVEDEVVGAHDASRFVGEVQYEFRHALLREAAYELLTADDRQLGHKLAGEWLEQVGEHDAGVIAEHFRRGDDPRALSWFQRAAEQSLDANDLENVLARAEAAVSCGATGAELGRMRLMQAEVHVWQSDHHAAEVRLTEALATLPAGNAHWCRAAAGMLAAVAHLGNVQRLVGLVGELQSVRLAPDARGAYVVPASFVVSYACVLGMYPLATGFLERARDVSGEVARHEPVVAGWLHLAERQHARFVTGDPAAYLRIAGETVSAFQRGGDRRGELLARAWEGHALANVGAYAEAAATLREVVEASVGSALVYVEGTARAVLSAVSAALGDAELAAQEGALATAQLGDTNRVLGGFARTMLGRAYLARRELKLAEAELAGAAETLSAAPPYRALALASLAQARSMQGRVAQALEPARQALEIVDTLGAFEDGEALARLVYAEVLEVTGDRAAATREIERARTRLRHRAESLTDPVARERFLRAVPENARTLQLAAACGVR